MRLRAILAAVLVAAAALAVTAVVAAQRGDQRRVQTVTLRNADGKLRGTAILTQARKPRTVQVDARVVRQPPGFHGLHVHSVGRCEPPAFTSAMGHLKEEDQAHGAHSGDLPPLLVKRNGTATLRVTTDRFDLRELRDDDGSALIVHAGPDNFGNIPSRYASEGPDEETRDTGDSGSRVLCGAIRGR